MLPALWGLGTLQLGIKFPLGMGTGGIFPTKGNRAGMWGRDVRGDEDGEYTLIPKPPRCHPYPSYRHHHPLPAGSSSASIRSKCQISMLGRGINTSIDPNFL